MATTQGSAASGNTGAYSVPAPVNAGASVPGECPILLVCSML